jgi:hypothetical protein
MAQLQAQAYPRKHFFVEMFTRDISLIDCMLDLIDNAVDGLIRSRELDLGKSLLMPDDDTTPPSGELPAVEIEFSEREFVIRDNCGGIAFADAEKEVFNFGHSHALHGKAKQHQLGLYGVGLKRAIFKIGKQFHIISKTKDDGFETEVDLDEWITKDDSLQDWTFPLRKLPGARRFAEAGTTIKIQGIREEVRTAIHDPAFDSRLHDTVASAYALFLHRYIKVSIRGQDVPPLPIPVGESGELKPAIKTFSDDGVQICLIGSIAKRDTQGRWTAEQAGWYVACNGRLVVAADKTQQTGWGTGALPEFHSKYRGFVGLALFQSDDAFSLPWKTTKSGLNLESLVYQRVRTQMNALTRPILSFLDRMYPSEPSEEPVARRAAGGVAGVDVRQLTTRENSGFLFKPEVKTRLKTTLRVQFDAEKSDIEKIKKHLRRPDLTAGAVGKHVFEQYLIREKLQ